MKKLEDVTIDELKELYDKNMQFAMEVDASIADIKKQEVDDMYYIYRPVIDDITDIHQWSCYDGDWSLILKEDAGDKNEIHNSDLDYMDDAWTFAKEVEEYELKEYSDNRDVYDKLADAYEKWTTEGAGATYLCDITGNIDDDEITDEYLELCRACREVLLDIEHQLKETEKVTDDDIRDGLENYKECNAGEDWETDGTVVIYNEQVILR